MSFTRSGSRRISTGDVTRNAPKYLSSLNHSYISFIPSGNDFWNNSNDAKFPNNTVGFRKGTPRFFQKSNVDVRKQYKIPSSNPGNRNFSKILHILNSLQSSFRNTNIKLFFQINNYDVLLFLLYL